MSSIERSQIIAIQQQGRTIAQIAATMIDWMAAEGTFDYVAELTNMEARAKDVAAMCRKMKRA